MSKTDAFALILAAQVLICLMIVGYYRKHKEKIEQEVIEEKALADEWDFNHSSPPCPPCPPPGSFTADMILYSRPPWIVAADFVEDTLPTKTIDAPKLVVSHDPKKTDVISWGHQKGQLKSSLDPMDALEALSAHIKENAEIEPPTLTWVISSNFGDPDAKEHYFTMALGMLTNRKWTSDVNEALQFRRQQDAERVAKFFGVPTGVVVERPVQS